MCMQIQFRYIYKRIIFNWTSKVTGCVCVHAGIYREVYYSIHRNKFIMICAYVWLWCSLTQIVVPIRRKIKYKTYRRKMMVLPLYEQNVCMDFDSLHIGLPALGQCHVEWHTVIASLSHGNDTLFRYQWHTQWVHILTNAMNIRGVKNNGHGER